MPVRFPRLASSSAARTVTVVGIIAIAMVTGGALVHRGARTGTFTTFEGTRLFESVFRHVKTEFVEPMTDSALYLKSVDGMLYELNDPYSAFLPPERFARLHETT